MYEIRIFLLFLILSECWSSKCKISRLFWADEIMIYVFMSNMYYLTFISGADNIKLYIEFCERWEKVF